jgi:cytochrome c2
MRALPFLLLALAAGPAWAGVGESEFNDQCASCHTLSGVSTTSGPSLKGVVWRKIASVRDFAYSPGLKAQVGAWSPDRMDRYLANSQAVAPGTSMFWDISDPATRKAIIGYLKTVK